LRSTSLVLGISQPKKRLHIFGTTIFGTPMLTKRSSKITVNVNDSGRECLPSFDFLSESDGTVSIPSPILVTINVTRHMRHTTQSHSFSRIQVAAISGTPHPHMVGYRSCNSHDVVGHFRRTAKTFATRSVDFHCRMVLHTKVMVCNDRVFRS
jgi:hypothetical protein